MSDCQCHQRGSIHLIIGPMFSGKTTELFRLAQRYILAGRKVAVVKYALDTRYDESHACTHDKRKMEAISATKMEDAFEELNKFDVIGIDEGQFFKDIVKYAQELANTGKTVIIAALNGDYRQEPFQNVAMLIPLAEKIEKLSAVCRCGQSASFTFRMSECTKLEMIGGQELYRALCRTCVVEYNRVKEQLLNGMKNGNVSLAKKRKASDAIAHPTLRIDTV
ncbi:hypothetical protein niasHT_022663 [Heterodera trifolii]|uniref:Thymidine kinase n=1 Tax=Heterodera trifolii TaxID=157864 RepID=A0ABD2JRJ4_9BILA